MNVKNDPAAHALTLLNVALNFARDAGNVEQQDTILYVMRAIDENARLREALAPFVAAFAHNMKRYADVGSAWGAEMPGDWPTRLAMSMDDCRRARASLEAKQ